MNETFKKILKTGLWTIVAVAGILAIVGNKEIVKHFKEGMEKIKNKTLKKNKDFDDSGLLLIAEEMKCDINNAAHKTCSAGNEYGNPWHKGSRCNG